LILVYVSFRFTLADDIHRTSKYAANIAALKNF